MELITEALWVSSKRLIWSEWVTAASTTLASTFAGFAPGIGVGLGIMILLQYWDHLKDTVGHSAYFADWYANACASDLRSYTRTYAQSCQVERRLTKNSKFPLHYHPFISAV